MVSTHDYQKDSRNKDINLNIAVTDYDGEAIYYENSPINQQNSLIQLNENQQIMTRVSMKKLSALLFLVLLRNIKYQT